MENFTIITQMTAKEYGKTFLSQFYKKPLYIFITILGLYMLTTVVFDRLGIIDYYSETFPSELFTGLFLLLFPVLITLVAVRQFSSNPACQGVMKYTFGETGIAVEGDAHKSEFAWSYIIRQKEMRKYLVLFQSKKIGMFIDKTAMTPEQLQFIKAKVKRK